MEKVPEGHWLQEEVVLLKYSPSLHLKLQGKFWIGVGKLISKQIAGGSRIRKKEIY